MNIKQIIREEVDEFEVTDNYIYHGTSYDNAINMVNNGLIESTYWGGRDNAEGYAYSYNEPVLIKVLKSDIMGSTEPNHTLINYYRDNIKEDDNSDTINLWDDSDKTVEDSLNIFDSVILPPISLYIDENDIVRI